MIYQFQKLLPLILALLITSGCTSNCVNAQNVSDKNRAQGRLASNADLSTDEAVLAELQKMIDAKNAAGRSGDEKLDAKKKAAGRLKAGDVCIERLKDAAIIVIGFFRTDAGCRFEGAFVDARYFERTDADLSKTALAALGWEKSPQKKRETLAALWVEKALLVFSPLPEQALSAVSGADKKIKVTASSQYPAGVTSRNAAKVFVFDRDGGFSAASDY
jgi:hypothetical protein